MELRLIEVVLPSDVVGRVPELLADHRTLGIWDESLDESHRLSRVLVRAREVEAIVDRVESEFRHHSDLRIIVFRVEATVRRVVADHVGIVNGGKESPDDAGDRGWRDDIDLRLRMSPDRQAVQRTNQFASDVLNVGCVVAQSCLFDG